VESAKNTDRLAQEHQKTQVPDFMTRPTQRVSGGCHI
jgi:hypothetical protein